MDLHWLLCDSKEKTWLLQIMGLGPKEKALVLHLFCFGSNEKQWFYIGFDEGQTKKL